ncbi:MAG: response regulator [Myxococcales bacterium]|nr:response regulator [Myxococcales bacterium]
MYDKVLVVDDEPEVIEGLKVALRKEPYEVIGAHSAAEARVILSREPVGAIVVDERMPGQSGSEFLAELAKEQPHLPKIMLTGHADLQVAVRSINEGRVFRLLQKPCETDELAMAIRDALRKHAVKSVTQRLVHLSRRQAVLVEELDRESAGSTDPGLTGLMSTQEMPSVAVSDDEADPVAMLSPEESANLSRREKEILRAMVAGKKPRELAHMFFISVHTARNHVKAIYRKLGVHSQGELIAKVLRAPGRVKFRPAS